ncbi:ankyrin repeat domain-containing protein [Pollutibacter soli]|uniref:ankyrin repeat domain-containing protein n=1 Tax=Pollutibacter soli TaxID=3034157 RepID=UPI003013B491
MRKPIECERDFPIKLSNNVFSTTGKVWDILYASFVGDLEAVKKLVSSCAELIYAQYNYMPPIHLAVREGHKELVVYLLKNGAHNPAYNFYPFQESLQVIARDRGFDDIALMLDEYAAGRSIPKYHGDNGEIDYGRTELQKEFEQQVDKENMGRVSAILKEHPEFALDPTYFWSEGVLLFAAKEYNVPMMELLMSYGATVPSLLKWTQFYYFERTDSAKYLLERGMNPNTGSWQNVSILHDMAQKGFIDRAELLIKHGADINAIDDEYSSTPLGMAARWGREEMVLFLLKNGADPNLGGAAWASPLRWASAKNYPAIERSLFDAGGRI